MRFRTCLAGLVMALGLTLFDSTPTLAEVPDWVVFPDQQWQTLAPAEAGIRDLQAWNRWLEAATKSARGASFQGEDHSGDQWGVAVTRGGYLVQTFGDPDYKYQTASLGKAFTIACLQLALDEGRIKSVDDGHQELLDWRR